MGFSKEIQRFDALCQVIGDTLRFFENPRFKPRGEALGRESLPDPDAAEEILRVKCRKSNCLDIFTCPYVIHIYVSIYIRLCDREARWFPGHIGACVRRQTSQHCSCDHRRIERMTVPARARCCNTPFNPGPQVPGSWRAGRLGC